MSDDAKPEAEPEAPDSEAATPAESASLAEIEKLLADEAAGISPPPAPDPSYGEPSGEPREEPGRRPGERPRLSLRGVWGGPFKKPQNIRQSIRMVVKLALAPLWMPVVALRLRGFDLTNPFVFVAGAVIYIFGQVFLSLGFGYTMDWTFFAHNAWTWIVLTGLAATVIVRDRLDDGELNFSQKSVLIPVALWVLMSGLILTNWLRGWTVWNADAYANALPHQTLEDTTSRGSAARASALVLPTMDRFFQEGAPEQVRSVGQKSARTAGDGVLPADLANLFQTGVYRLQIVQGKLTWVAPLCFRGDLRNWWLNSDGPPGFVMVSAVDENDARLVRADSKGQPFHIVYQPKARFLWNLDVHLKLSGYFFYALGEPIFEVDDELRPHWVVPVLSNRAGYRLPAVVRVAIVDAESGAITWHAIDDAPSWVDRAQPEDVLVDQIRWCGRYVGGFWNYDGWAILGGGNRKGCFQPTAEDGTVIQGKDGGLYMVYDVTSFEEGDENSYGFFLVNCRSGEGYYQLYSGTNTWRHKKALEDEYRDLKFKPDNPVLTQIGGIPTYVVSVLDDEATIHAVHYVSMRNPSLSGKGETKQEAYQSYLGRLQTLDGLQLAAGEIEEGRVAYLNQVMLGGQTWRYFRLEGDPRRFKVLMSESVALREGLWMAVGDRVRFSHTGAGDILMVSAFQTAASGPSKKEEEGKK